MDFQKNAQKFDFFKKHQSLNFGFKSGNNRRDLFPIFAIAIWLMYGLVSTQTYNPSTVHMAQVVQNGIADKISLIDKVTNLNSMLSATPLKDISVKDIGEDLELVIKSAHNSNSSISIIGYTPDTKEPISLKITENKVVVTWENITPKEAEEFKEFWSGEARILDKATNFKKLEVSIAMAPVELPKVEEIKNEDKVHALQDRVQNLEKENDALKKQNAQNVVTKAVQDNPHLKIQEEQIRNYVDKFMEIQKNQARNKAYTD